MIPVAAFPDTCKPRRHNIYFLVAEGSNVESMCMNECMHQDIIIICKMWNLSEWIHAWLGGGGGMRTCPTHTYLRFWNQTLICLGSMCARMGQSLMSCWRRMELGLGHSWYTCSRASTCSFVYRTYFPHMMKESMPEWWWSSCCCCCISSKTLLSHFCFPLRVCPVCPCCHQLCRLRYLISEFLRGQNGAPSSTREEASFHKLPQFSCSFSSRCSRSNFFSPRCCCKSRLESETCKDELTAPSGDQSSYRTQLTSHQSSATVHGGKLRSRQKASTEQLQNRLIRGSLYRDWCTRNSCKLLRN